MFSIFNFLIDLLRIINIFLLYNLKMDVYGVLLYEVIEYLDLRYFLILEAVSKKI